MLFDILRFKTKYLKAAVYQDVFNSLGPLRIVYKV